MCVEVIVCNISVVFETQCITKSTHVVQTFAKDVHTVHLLVNSWRHGSRDALFNVDKWRRRVVKISPYFAVLNAVENCWMLIWSQSSQKSSLFAVPSPTASRYFVKIRPYFLHNPADRQTNRGHNITFGGSSKKQKWVDKKGSYVQQV